MSILYMKQKVFSVGEKFTVTDEQGDVRYKVKGSVLKIPKEFRLQSVDGKLVAKMKKKIVAFFPTFYVDMANGETIVIKKQFSFLRPKYSISIGDLQVNGDWWDMSFTVTNGKKQVAKINKKWISWGDSYAIQIRDTRYEDTIVALVVAIDYVKASEKQDSGE